MALCLIVSHVNGTSRFVSLCFTPKWCVYVCRHMIESPPAGSRAVVEVVVKPAQGQGGLKERRLEQLLAGCCECCLLSSLSPHTAVSIVLQVKTAQGLVSERRTQIWCSPNSQFPPPPQSLQLLSTLCLALCLAMVDAGLPLSSPFSSHSTSFTPDGDPHNPTLVQEEVSSQPSTGWKPVYCSFLPLPFPSLL